MLSRTGAPVALTLAAVRTTTGKADQTALDLEQELRRVLWSVLCFKGSVASVCLGQKKKKNSYVAWPSRSPQSSVLSALLSVISTTHPHSNLIQKVVLLWSPHGRLRGYVAPCGDLLSCLTLVHVRIQSRAVSGELRSSRPETN